jgi:hypothetical protein
MSGHWSTSMRSTFNHPRMAIDHSPVADPLALSIKRLRPESVILTQARDQTNTIRSHRRLKATSATSRMIFLSCTPNDAQRRRKLRQSACRVPMPMCTSRLTSIDLRRRHFVAAFQEEIAALLIASRQAIATGISRPQRQSAEPRSRQQWRCCKGPALLALRARSMQPARWLLKTFG